jgi:hypothetical protein
LTNFFSLTTLTTLKLVTDLGLLCSFIYLAHRFIIGGGVKFSDSKRVKELEQSLRDLIVEAENSSKGLIDELNNKRQDLKRVLESINAAESRIEEKSAEVEKAVTKVSPSKFKEETPTPEKLYISQHDALMERIPKPLEFMLDPLEIPLPPRFERPANYRNTETLNRTPLSDRVEVTRNVQEEGGVEEAQSYKNSVASILRAAESLLQAGHEINDVARETNLPLDHVRALSVLIKQSPLSNGKRGEERGKILKSDDSRLGVLSNARRG